MAKIILIDYSSEGHHASYTSTLLNGLKNGGHNVLLIGELNWVNRFADSVDSVFPVNIGNLNCGRLFNEINKYLFLLKCIRKARSLSPEIVHFLYLDHFVLASAFALRVERFQVRYTLHWGYMLPEFSFGIFNKIKSRVECCLLNRLARKGGRAMVHSRAMQKRLSQVTNINSFDYVPYPLQKLELVDRDLARRFVEGATGLGQVDRIVLVFGDTRYDKGADIAVRALDYLPKHYHLLIAGKADAYDEGKLARLAEVLDVRNRLHIHSRYILDSEIPLYFKGADVVLIPYRRQFAGQSGPLTIAASMGIPVAASNLLVLTETILSYDLGTVFIPDDPMNLAISLHRLEGCKETTRQAEFINDHSDNQFISNVFDSYFFGNQLVK